MRVAWIVVGVILPRLAFAYGEPDGAGRPNHRERLLHVFTNQVRQAPHEWPGWDTQKATAAARPPLRLHDKLLEAARFHADDMAAHHCFQHESCDGTTFPARLARYFNGQGAGENIYSAVGDKSERSAINGWMNSDGHRVNILTASWTELGTGFSEQAGQVYYVQDFGQLARAELPAIPGAAREIQGEQMTLYVNYYAADGAPPTELVAVLDGAKIPLVLESGAPGNGTYAATVATPACAPVHFVATPAQGGPTTFPTLGALLVGSACTEEYRGDQTGPGPNPGDSGPVVIDAAKEGGCRALAVQPGIPWSLGLLALLFLRPTRRRG